MNQEKYIGMDVHQATISVAVMDSSGKLIMECILETKAATILEFIADARRFVHEPRLLQIGHAGCIERPVGARDFEQVRLALPVIGSMHGNWPSYYTPTSSMLCTTESTGFAP